MTAVSSGETRSPGGSAAPLAADDPWLHEGPLPRWIGWRLRLLVGFILAGCVLVFALGHWLTQQPRLPFTLKATAEGQVKIGSASHPNLQRLEGLSVEGLRVDTFGPLGDVSAVEAPIDLLTLHRSARWIPRPEQRDLYVSRHAALHRVAASLPPQGGTVQVVLTEAPDEPIRVGPGGWSALPPLFWLLSLAGLVVSAVGAVVLLAGVQWRNAAFAVLALTQGGHLFLMAVECGLDVFMPAGFIELDMALRTGFDVVSAAAMVQVAVLHPRKLSSWPLWSSLGWTAAVVLVLLQPWAGHWQWWGFQAGCAALVLVALVLMTVSYRLSPHPLTLLLRRFTLITLGCWVVLCMAIGLSDARPDLQLSVATFGVMVWHVFFASQLLLSPYLSRTRPILQEFSLLAASSTVAASLDLLFVAVFSLGQFSSMTLSLFLSFGLYLSIRRWVMHHVLSRDALTTEGLFERLYRIARELERQPERLHDLMSGLMRELFDPLHTRLTQSELPHCQLRGNGAVLLVPIPRLTGAESAAAQAFVLRHADKGRRLFTSEDARLADRIVEQLHRVLTYDRAVEQGRSEERLRLAQDLHDDIGARLLTLMYQAPNPEIEEYIRHTLQDLKTLTRGLSVQRHTLVEAASEWKRDLNHRLNAARCELDWTMSCDHDVALSVVQWSALTRILRELVNNTISHARASKVVIRLALADDRLTLTVSDNGLGREPETWSHGLGLGGVRKRVKQLGGVVAWREVTPKGISCDVVVDHFSGAATP